MSVLYGLPFLGVILALSVMPLLLPHSWHRRERKVLGILSGIGVVSVCHFASVSHGCTLLTETLWREFIPFLLMVIVLYTVCGGIAIRLNDKATPVMNVIVLAVASCFASFVGTTGASMLFIRPFLQLNKGRQHQAHCVVFFIMIVCNAAGVVTPLGDPPLFMGYLQGVPFFWTVVNLWGPFVVMMTGLLGLFIAVDYYFWRQEVPVAKGGIDEDKTYHKARWTLEGAILFGVLAAVVVVVVFYRSIPVYSLGSFMDTPLYLHECCYGGIMVALGLGAYRYAMPQVHDYNQFSWKPVADVGWLFLALFITLIPINHMLDMKTAGPLAPLFGFLQDNPVRYFWLTGFCSSILDNAPTYLVFFKAAGGVDAIHPVILKAISLSAVFMGALTYIGNAPNLMVWALAKQYGVKMPNFLLYSGWAFMILMPLLWIITILFL